MSLTLTVPVFAYDAEATPRAVAVVRRQLDAFMFDHDVDEGVRGRARQAVGEAVTNVVRHAYAPGSGPVTVIADIEADLQIVVADDGGGLAPGETPGIGLGLEIVAGLADELTLRERDSGGVEVWMRFALPDV